MDYHYPSLELIEHDTTSGAPELAKYDETARAPERDYDVTAFKLDASALAPQVVSHTAPQVLYNNSFPEAHSDNEELITEHAPSLQRVKSTLRWPFMILALIVAAAIAVGVGVGIWRHRDHSSPPVSQNHGVLPASQIILNDTSLAALIGENGDRYLFFQDTAGLIQYVVRNASNNRWSMSKNQNLSLDSNPKNHTPLTVTLNNPPGISLYYISESHYLNASQFDGAVWTPDLTLGKNYSTAVGTRSLSLNSVPYNANTTIDTQNSAILYYENPTGNVSALLQRTTTTTENDSTDYNGRSWSQKWFDITSQESESLPNEFRNTDRKSSNKSLYSSTLYESNTNATYSTPFTSGPNFAGWNIGALFYSPSNTSLDGSPLISGGGIVAAGYTMGLNGTGKFSAAFARPPAPYLDSIRQSDFAIFGSNYAICISGTQPANLNASIHGVELPDNVFPFTRLASVILGDQSSTLLYHQMNGTTFAEELWDDSSQAWIATEYITVSGS